MPTARQRYRLPSITAEMTVTNPRAAAVDVGSRFHAAALPPHLSPEPCRTFGVTTPDLREMAAWMRQHDITTVVLESTGNYWVQPYRILEAAGLEVVLVHPEYARQAKRTKYSDLDDSVWLQQMHAYGLLPASFVPTAPFQRLRTLWRHHDRLVANQGRCVQRMQDALDLMNLQLHKVLTDVTGVTGLAIIRAIVRGEHAPETLAQYRDRRCKCTPEEMHKALTGDYREEELFVLTQVLAQYDHAAEQLTACDAQIEQCLQTLATEMSPAPAVPTPVPPAPAPPAVADAVADAGVPPRTPPTGLKPNVAPPDTRRKKRSKHEPTAYDWHALLVQLCGADLTRICGLSVLVVLGIIAEIGTDLTPWDTARRFTAWLGLAPDHRVTGGKVIKRHTRRGKPKAAHAFYLAALAVTKSQTPLGEFYRYQKARLGPKKALTATARKIAILYYHLLKYGPTFVEQGQRQLAQHAQQRKLRKLRRLAAELGVELVESAPAA